MHTILNFSRFSYISHQDFSTLSYFRFLQHEKLRFVELSTSSRDDVIYVRPHTLLIATAHLRLVQQISHFHAVSLLSFFVLQPSNRSNYFFHGGCCENKILVAIKILHCWPIFMSTFTINLLMPINFLQHISQPIMA